ncbi:MAG: PAS domain S-box protein [Usitatibacter sp.]
MATSIQHRPALPVEQLQRRVTALEQELESMRQRECAWTAREQELSDFVENAIVGLHKVGPDGTILWANTADYETLGYTREQYVGHNIAEFHADHDQLSSILERLLAGKALCEQPAILKCKDGSIRHVLISSNSLFENGRFVNTRCFTRDVTQQRLAEAALQEARLHLAAVVESSVDAIVSVDLAGRINAWNRGAEQLFGYSREEIVGHPIFIIVPQELHDEERGIFAKVLAGERVEHYETLRTRKDGKQRHVSLTVSPVRDASGAFIGISKVGRDITERKEAQRELAEAARRKDEFLAILAHELRNPLAPIRYALTITKQPKTTEAQRQRADEVIERQVEHMSQLLDDLLDVSRIARGHVELKKKWIDLTSVIGGAIDAARPLLDRKGHALALDLPRETLRLEADPVRLTQILSNLLTNAAKYTDPGGQIQLRACQDGDRVTLSVRDNGIGISADMKTRLFDLFAQATPALHRSEGGLGIGLALVKAFVEKHGGTVVAKSDGAGRGSEFTVSLPIGRAPSAKRSPRASGQMQLAAKRLRVLVADDNVDSTQTSSMLLELWGHEVRVAHTGREALDLAAQFMPDVALLDIGMPDLSGYEVAQTLRARPEGKRVTLIAVTGWGQEEDKQAADGAGFNHHLTKPVDPRQLQTLMESIC